MFWNFNCWLWTSKCLVDCCSIFKDDFGVLHCIFQEKLKTVFTIMFDWLEKKLKKNWLLSVTRGIFTIKSNIYDGAFLRKQLTDFSHWTISAKSSIINQMFDCFLNTPLVSVWYQDILDRSIWKKYLELFLRFFCEVCFEKLRLWCLTAPAFPRITEKKIWSNIAKYGQTHFSGQSFQTRGERENFKSLIK